MRIGFPAGESQSTPRLSRQHRVSRHAGKHNFSESPISAGTIPNQYILHALSVGIIVRLPVLKK